MAGASSARRLCPLALHTAAGKLRPPASAAPFRVRGSLQYEALATLRRCAGRHRPGCLYAPQATSCLVLRGAPSSWAISQPASRPGASPASPRQVLGSFPAGAQTSVPSSRVQTRSTRSLSTFSSTMANPIARRCVLTHIMLHGLFFLHRAQKTRKARRPRLADVLRARRAAARCTQATSHKWRTPAAGTSAIFAHKRAKFATARKNRRDTPTEKNRRDTTGLLRHVHRRPAGGAHRDDAPRGRRAQDGRELPLPLHGREGCRGRVPLFSNSVAQWIAYQTSNLGVAGSSPVGVVSPIARRPFSIRGRVGLSSTMNQKGVGFKPQSLRRRGFEPHRMHT